MPVASVAALVGIAVLLGAGPTSTAAEPATAAPTATPPPVLLDGVELRPLPPAVAALNPAVLDGQVGRSIRDAADYLLDQFDDQGELPKATPAQEMSRQALHAICAYALLSAGQATGDADLRPTDPKIARIVDNLKALPMESSAARPNQPVVLARSMRAAALALYGRPADRTVLRADVDWLVRAHFKGAYSHDDVYVRVWRPADDGEVVGVIPGDPGPRVSGVGGQKPSGFNPGAEQVGKPKQGVGAPPPPNKPVQRPTYPRWPMHYARRPNPQAPRVSRAPARPIHPSSGRPQLGAVRPPPQIVAPPPPRVAPQPPPPRVAPQEPPRVAPQPPPRVAPQPPPRVAPQPPPREPPKVAPQAPPKVASQPPPPGVARQPNPPTVYRDEPDPVPVDDAPPWDNLNSQLGIFGVWCGAWAGATVPKDYWAAVLGHWSGCQLPDGQWPFFRGETGGGLAMTAGGAAAMLMAGEWSQGGDLVAKYVEAKPPRELLAALAWLEQGKNVVTTPGPRTRYVGFDLFAVARVGLIGGYKYLGDHDWYRELADRAVRTQLPDGSWAADRGEEADTVANTAFHALFLSLGRHPVLANKLKFATGDSRSQAWQARPRDLANVTRFVAQSVERPLNWQVVDLRRPAGDWLDSPVLYVAGNEPPRLGAADHDRVRHYVRSGGMVFLHADAGSGAVNRWAPEFCAQVAPGHRLDDLPADHPLYTVVHKLSADKLRLKAVRNGSRVLVLLATRDVANAWQTRATKAEADAHRLMINVYAYAHGRTNPRMRLDPYEVPEPPEPPQVKVPVARLKWDGNWDPEPGAWARAGRFLHWETGAGVDARPLAVAELTPGAAPLAHLTGTGAYAPTEADAAALRAYVEAGGVLLVDACGGDAAFRQSAEQKLAACFPGLSLADADRAAAPFAPVFDVMDDLTGEPALRAYVSEKLGGPAAGTIRTGRFGKGWVVYSPLDLTTGLAGSNAWGVAGYAPDYAVGLAKNLLVWSAAGRARAAE